MADLISIIPLPPQSAVEVYYNGLKIVPAPLVEWNVESQFRNDGTRVSTMNRLTLTGTTLITPSGSYEQMYAKQQALRSTFSQDYKNFMILAGPGNRTLAQGTVISSGLLRSCYKHYLRYRPNPRWCESTGRVDTPIPR